MKVRKLGRKSVGIDNIIKKVIHVVVLSLNGGAHCMKPINCRKNDKISVTTFQ